MKKSGDIKDKRKAKKTKRHLIRKAIGLGLLGTATAVTTTAVGAWGAWQYAKAERHNRRRNHPLFDKVITANRYCGQVHKDERGMTLTTPSATYHLLDPLSIVDGLVKARSEQAKADKKDDPSLKISDYDNTVYDIEVCVLGELSKKGRYGYLGHLPYQLTIVGVVDEAVPVEASSVHLL